MLFRSQIVVAMMDARRDRVFTGVYRMEDFPVQLKAPDAVPVEELVEFLKECTGLIIAVGDGATVYREELIRELGDRIIFSPGHLNLSSASAVCRLGLNRFNKGITEDLFTMAPNYLRDSQAQRSLKDKR